MAGIFSQGGSAGHRYAGWLSEVEAKNFTFGGKVFNGSPSAIYVGSNLVWAYWLKPATQQAILGAFGQRDGMAVINATNAYLNQLAASDRDKATALAGFINTYAVEDAHIVYSLVPTLGVTRWLVGDGSAYIDTGVTATDTQKFKAHFKFDTFSGAGAILGNNANWTFALRFHNAANSLGWFMVNGMYHKYSFDTYGIHEVELAKDFMKIDGEIINRENDSNSAIGGNVRILRCGAGIGAARISYFYMGVTDDYELRKMYPFIRNNVNGMLDLISGTFYANAGSGSFTISETPSTP